MALPEWSWVSFHDEGELGWVPPAFRQLTLLIDIASRDRSGSAGQI